jgi:hypothetical protein
MNRRAFLTVLSGLPILGKYIRTPVAVKTPRIQTLPLIEKHLADAMVIHQIWIEAETRP